MTLAVRTGEQSVTWVMVQHRSVIGFSAYPVCQSGLSFSNYYPNPFIACSVSPVILSTHFFVIYPRLANCWQIIRVIACLNLSFSNLLITSRNNVIKDHYSKEAGEIGFNRIMKYRSRYRPRRRHIYTCLSRFTGLLWWNICDVLLSQSKLILEMYYELLKLCW